MINGIKITQLLTTAAIILYPATLVRAQETSTETQAESQGLEEITVTARKRDAYLNRARRGCEIQGIGAHVRDRYRRPSAADRQREDFIEMAGIVQDPLIGPGGGICG